MAPETGRLRGYLALAPGERREFLACVVALATTAVELRWRGLRGVRERSFRIPLPPDAAPDPRAARRLARLLDLAARHGPFRARCLVRSLCLERMLRRRGIHCAFRLGAVPEAGALAAHAWVECAGEPLNEAPGVPVRFGSFDF